MELIYYLIKHSLLFLIQINILSNIIPELSYTLFNYNFIDRYILFDTPQHIIDIQNNIFNIEAVLYFCEFLWLYLYDIYRIDIPKNKYKKYMNNNFLMRCHHITTIALIMFFGKYFVNGYSFLIICIHNQSDIFLNLFKLLFEVEDNIKNNTKSFINMFIEFICAILFIGSWINTRLVILPIIIYSIAIYSPKYFIINSLYTYIIYISAISLLFAIQIYQIIWTKQIIYYSFKKLNK